MVEGFGENRFLPVRKVLAELFQTGLDLGAGVCATLDGETVFHYYGGFQDRRQQTIWAEDTLVCVFSSGKAVMALLVAGAVEHGLLDYEQPVATYWPEFAAAGKQDITVAQIMSHQAGLCGFTDEIDPLLWTNWQAICDKLAEMEPLWTPGQASGYHPQTYGFLSGELLRRVTGKMPGTLIKEYFQKPFNIDVYCGLEEAQMNRVAPMVKPTAAPVLGALTELKKHAFLKKGAGPNGIDAALRMRAQIPGANMHATARGLAEFMIPLANNGMRAGKQTLSTQTIDALMRERISGDDLVLPFHLSWGAGLMRNTNYAYGPNINTLGHSGFGGSCVFADLDQRLTFSYVMNKMSPDLIGDPRPTQLIDALYACL